MGSKTITNKEYNNLIKKSKAGWASFYRSEADAHQRDILYLEAIHDLKLKLEGTETEFPSFVANELRDLMISLKKQIECPICMDELNAKDIKFSSCGHKYCQTCLSKLDECAVCRKKIYKK
jgi:late competence protein required for DNA uptake (superfamily II DNA/RNA helicase)